jgi:hypothetical protein
MKIQIRPGRKSLMSVGLAAFAGLALIAGTSGAFANPSTNWQLADGSAQVTSTGVAAFNFSVPDKAHLLYNSKDPALLGGQLGSTMSASAAVAGVTGTFTYGGEPSCGGTTGNVRLYFESIPPGAKFAFTNYWWADAAFTTLADGSVSLTATVDPAQPWSDWNGQPSASNASAFTAAASNITAVGLSFGGGCFFENGVGTTDGSGSFTLNSFSS